MDQEQLIEIQTRLAFQEDMIQELNTTISCMQKSLDDLTVYCQTLRSKMTEMETLLPADQPADERPPHY